MVAVVLAASVVLLSWSVMFMNWADRQDTRWLLAIESVLILLAVISPNPWVGFAIAWIALHPWITWLGYNYGPLQFSPVREDVYRPLFPVLWWAVIYIVAAHYLHFEDWSIIAWSIIIWSLVNVAAAIYQESGLPAPSWWKDAQCPDFPYPPGLVGGSFMLAWITSIGAMSALWLAVYSPDIRFITIPITVILAYCSLTSGSWSPIVAACISVMLLWGRNWYSSSTALILVPAMFMTGVETKALVKSTSLSSRLTGWVSAVRVIRQSRGIGCGLGIWGALTHQDSDIPGLHHRNLHNDWLQSLVELGPIPAMCGIGAIYSMWSSFPITPGAQFGVLLSTSIAIYALWYFPMRDHTPSLLLAVSLALIGK